MKRLFLSVMVLLFVTINSEATTLFSHNFDAESDIPCPSYPSAFSGYETTSGCVNLGDGLYTGMVKGPGFGGSGKAFYNYTKGTSSSAYNQLAIQLSQDVQELYIRFYIYIDSDVVSTGDLYYQKFLRFRLSSGEAFFIEPTGSTFAGSTWRVISAIYGYNTSTGLLMSEISRNTWHSLEFHVKLLAGANSTVQTWLDGVSQGILTNVYVTQYSNTVFDHNTGSLDIAIGMGNQGSGGSYQATAEPVIIDEIIVSTVPIGGTLDAAPSVSITSPSEATEITSDTLSVSWDQSDDGTIIMSKWRIGACPDDGNGTQDDTSPATASGFSEGINYIYIGAKDDAGNWGCDGSPAITYNPAGTLPIVTITAQDATATEAGPTTGMFRFTRDGSSGNLAVYFALSGTASSDDYYSEDLTAGYVTITDGNTYLDQAITPTQNSDTEDEVLICTLSTNAAYTIGSPDYATIDIIDNTTSAAIVSSVWGENSVSAYTSTMTDTFIAQGGGATTNYSEYEDVRQYWSNGGNYDNISIIRVDLSAASEPFSRVTLELYQFSGFDDDDADVAVHRISGVTPVIAEATGTVYSTGNNWTDSAFGVSDIEVAEDTLAVGLSPGWKIWSITQMAQWAITNNSGILFIYLKNGTGDTETARYFHSSDSPETAYRPIVRVVRSVSVITGGGGTVTSGGGGTITVK